MEKSDITMKEDLGSPQRKESTNQDPTQLKIKS